MNINGKRDDKLQILELPELPAEIAEQVASLNCYLCGREPEPCCWMLAEGTRIGPMNFFDSFQFYRLCADHAAEGDDVHKRVKRQLKDL